MRLERNRKKKKKTPELTRPPTIVISSEDWNCALNTCNAERSSTKSVNARKAEPPELGC